MIIPLKKCNDYLKENITALLAGSFENFEIIVLPDGKENVSYAKTKIVPTGKVGPAEKRDMGAKVAKGEILAFIDDDAYPSGYWLKNAYKQFNNNKIAAVCGPGITPPHDSIFQKASGAFSASLLGGGPYTYRFLAKNKRMVDDFPSMNLLVRKTDFWKVKGFDSDFWPGEDTKLCHDLVHILKKKIVYHPSVLVYHHRRAIFRQHLKQNGRYGLYRGFFARILPKTSLRVSYLIPSFLLIGFFLLPLLFFLNQQLFFIDLFLIIVYLLLVIISGIFEFFQDKNIVVALLLMPTIIITHLFYGGKFIQGFFFTKKLARGK